jgi:hypothetical protein
MENESKIKEIVSKDSSVIIFQELNYWNTLLILTVSNQQMKSFKILLEHAIIRVSRIQGELGGVRVDAEYTVGGDTIKEKNVWHRSDLGAQVRKYETPK